jgi:hypothetical protein
MAIPLQGRTARTQATRTQVGPGGYRDITVTGMPTEVARILGNHAASGNLVAATAPHPVAPRDPRVRMVLRLREATAPTPRLRTRVVLPRKVRLGVAVAASAAGVLAVAAYLIGQLVEFLAAHAAVIIGALAVAVIALTALLKALGGGSRHCPGC